MHNLVDKIIAGFTPQELRKFKDFVSRNNGATDRSDLLVIDAIRRNEKEEVQSNASRQARKRIKVQLSRFAMIENTIYDETSEISSMIEMAKYLFRKNLYEEAWNYLVSAEEMAIRMEEYELLNFIYYVQISYSSNLSIGNVPLTSTVELLDKCDRNLSLAITDIRANSANAYLTHEISELFSKKLHVNMDQLVDAVLKKYDLDDNVYGSPKIYSKIVNLVCRALRSKQDYVKLKEYAMKSYYTMTERGLFSQVSYDFRVEVLRSVCSSTLRTKDYGTCATFLELYRSEVKNYELSKHDKYLYYRFLSGITTADFLMCTGKLQAAREQLLELNEHYFGNKQPLIHFMLRINLLTVYFKCREYGMCIKMINTIMQQDQKKILKAIGMGLEILLYTDIYVAMIHYDNDDKDFAHHTLQRTKRKYADVLKLSVSSREQLFIKILENLVNDASYVSSKKFASDHARFVKLREYVPGDKEYISFNAWLSSKLTGKTYYECFHELVNSKPVVSVV